MCKSENMDIHSTCGKRRYYSFTYLGFFMTISSYISLMFNFYPENRDRVLVAERVDRIHESEILFTERISFGLKV